MKKTSIYSMSGDEWRLLTFTKGWVNRYSEGDIIEVFYKNGRVYRYRVVSKKVAEII